MNLARLGEENLEKYGEYVALVFEGKEYTNREQHRAANRLANALRGLGVGVGDRVVVMLPNCPEVPQSCAAILTLGAVVVPVIFLLSPEEVKHILGDSEAKVVITSTDMLWKVEPLIGALPTLRHVVLVDGDGERTLGLAGLAKGEPDTFTVVERADDDLAVILYTSGTTGQIKGVALSHRNLHSNARAAAALNELSREDWGLAVLPLSHSYGLMLMNAGNILGTRSVLLRWFNPEEVLTTIQKFRIRAMAGVPTMFVYLLNYPGAEAHDTSSMIYWGSGAAPLPLELVEPFEKKFGGRILEGYGLTEAAPLVSAHRISMERRLGSVGKPVPSVEVKILDADDRELPVGEAGEICVRSPGVMLGYYRLPEETAKTVRNGWLYTGDIGRLDADGYLYIVERKKDLIIRGGFNIYPREVEEVLYAHPKVVEAGVVAMPDPLMGEDVLAFVVLKAGQQATTEEIMAFCQEKLAKFKCPKQVRFVDSLPKNPIGKILKKELRRLIESNLA
ncbi:MAG: long-chain-fatty-acid--CoA ligase [Candidatus Rokubacteria bacterium]|nr:long-chain-fatty-acid--CoA ligase [Candidatus Rokubacteria bacterium]